MNTTEATDTVKIHTDHATEKHLGDWTHASSFEVKARYGSVVIDLRSPWIEGEQEIVVHADLDHAMVKLLVPEDAVIDYSELEWTGRGKVKDTSRPQHAAGRVIRLTGSSAKSEFRIHRGGIAVLSALFSREFFEDAKQARKQGRTPTLIDPANAPR
ncbi:hypothetical protein [Nocardia seriolae]|uniref:Uncharacterized protein n=1 Tax=Nocardia seriolae TaxID=37332 RepID=A0A0B8NPG7_9NOCA|nr:hypothetical protein [Nocardia seriolae]APB01380.1 hypothetical protein NS506_07360 [Nocardia seriolae]MTJ61130.1 hypothetical protein [Nocardia seriolae]MTJ75567.1 hypothetical protein [Nocardia seriolae]MTJ90743.1 hypothetical protein [Nocardia seriolae]MTK34702.1 hypothetical protein [Nocardia seriolae]